MESREILEALSATADTLVQLTTHAEPNAVPRVIVETVTQRLGCAAARLWLCDPATNTLRLEAWSGLGPDVDRADGAALTRETYGVPVIDVLHDGDVRTSIAPAAAPAEVLPAWMAQADLHGYALLPVVFGAPARGVLAAYTRMPLSAEHFQVLLVFARHASIALHDVTEQIRSRRQIEALAREAHARTGEFEAIVSNMPDLVVVVRGGMIAFANPTAVRLLGFDRAAQLCVPVAEFANLSQARAADGSPIPPERMIVSRVMAGEVVTGVEERMLNRRTGKDVWFQMSGAPLRGDDGNPNGGVVVGAEITRLKELEHSKDEWLAIAAHELRTPLTPITVHLQMAQRRLHMGRPIGPDVFDKALEQVKRLARLVNGLLDVTRLQAGQLELSTERVDLRDLAEAIVDRTRPGAPRHTLVLDTASRPVVIDGDRARLDEVIAALVDNAIKYSPQGGEVWISVQPRGRDAVVSVRDYGVGIAPDERAEIFERYFRAGSLPNTQYGGLGLGLWIANKVVQKHGGHMELESALGKGSTFRIAIPLSQAADEHPAPVPHPRSRRVLIVDDDAAVLDALQLMLADDGYDVRGAQSGIEALRTAHEWSPDVLLLDLRMPGMDGWEVRRRFASDPALASIPVVLVSADRDARTRAGSMNVQGFVSKPFDVGEIERVLGGILALPSSAPA